MCVKVYIFFSRRGSKLGFEHGRCGRLYSFGDCGWSSDPSRVIREGSVVSVPLLGVPCVSFISIFSYTRDGERPTARHGTMQRRAASSPGGPLAWCVNRPSWPLLQPERIREFREHPHAAALHAVTCGTATSQPRVQSGQGRAGRRGPPYAPRATRRHSATRSSAYYDADGGGRPAGGLRCVSGS